MLFSAFSFHLDETREDMQALTALAARYGLVVTGPPLAD